jgi:outer membrane immunogenic protein
MKKTMTLLSILLSSWASAEDVEKKWSGFYAGGQIGGKFNHMELNSQHNAFSDLNGFCNHNSSLSTPFLGGQAGIMHQLESKWVLGVEGDFSYNFSQSTQVQCLCDFDTSIYDRFQLINREQGSVMGRVGYAMPHHLLPYANAGVSFANIGLDYSNEGGNRVSGLSYQPGWLIGAGLEWAYSAKWSLRVEYNYLQYAQYQMNIYDIYGVQDPSGYGHLNVYNNNFKVALNYWF